MAWIDDRVWAHPKIAALTPSAFQAWVFAIAYSSGFGLYGRLDDAHLRLLDVSKKTRAELVAAGLWHEIVEQNRGGIEIHDWYDHNGKRDDIIEDRRRRDRERKRLKRAESERLSARTSADTSAEMSADVPQDVRASSLARARAGAPPMTSDGVTDPPTAALPPQTSDGAARDELAAAGWTPAQIATADDDLDRALALLREAHADPTCAKPGALAWTKYEAGAKPTRPSVARGAQGTRSTSTATASTAQSSIELPDRVAPDPTTLQALRELGIPAEALDDPEPGPPPAGAERSG